MSQPSRPKGRKGHLSDPPVIVSAREQGIETEQPASVADDRFLARLQELEPSVAVVVAFGQIFRRELLNLPTHGCINLHASLLPKYRGAAPIQAAIVAGERATGVTTMQMDEGLDSGDILLQRRVPIDDQETAAELAPRLARAGGDLMVETLDRLRAGSLSPSPQDDKLATVAPRLSKEDGRIDWDRSATEIFNQIRGLSPWPGTWSLLRDKSVKIVWATVRETSLSAAAPPGTVLGVELGTLNVACGGRSVLAVETLQRPGRKAVDGAAFVNGERLEHGERFE